VYHVLNRAVGRSRLFRKEGDYKAFEKVLREAHDRTEMRLLAYCVMPNHWHLVLWPREDGELSQYMRWLSVTHAQRWHAHHHTAGTGPLYQGRFKSFPIQDDRHFLIGCRYVERNPVRAGLVTRASDWRWSSASGGAGTSKPWLTPREAWPLPAPADWDEWVNAPGTQAELLALRRSVVRGAPFGDDRWTTRTARRLSLESSLRPPHRPKKSTKRKVKDS
jgi:putative transposase